MSANPVLVEVLRGNWVENIHRGAVCVSGPSGDILASAGDIEHQVFPRSAIKAMQALAIFASGAAEKFDLDDRSIALACASHTGQDQHVSVATATLASIGLSVDAYECGVHQPTDKIARKALAEHHEHPTAIHNNCSGKHAGMLAVARALGVSETDYVTRDHPVQKLVRKGVETVIGESLTEDRCGTDGCSIPTFAAPLRAFAQGFARMASGEGLDEATAKASRRIFDAATAHPALVRGTETLDSDLMAAFAGRLMIKIGAEGVYCGALRDTNIGFALKIDDGNMRAAEVAVANLLLAIANPNAAELAALKKYTTVELSNWRKIDVGQVYGTDAVRLKLA